MRARQLANKWETGILSILPFRNDSPVPSAAAAATYLDQLNPQQREAVEHGAGPLLVIAGAGSGKTNTLAHRVAHLVVSGADPRRILLLTFSRRAAAEMTRRVERIAAHVMGTSSGALTDALNWAGTFHAIGARLLREYAPQIGLDPQFTIHDREDSADLLNIVRHDIGLSGKQKRFPSKDTCLAIYSRVVNAELPLEEVLQSTFPWCGMWGEELRALFAAYVEAKQRQNVLDYDDLLLYWAAMAKQPALAADLGGRFDHVLVDEYQDTNRLQASILLALKPTGAGVTVVGDDAQSIYSFRAATVRNILDFPGHFAPSADIVTLDRNYRSTQPILNAANAVISEATERFTKNLWTQRQSATKPQLVAVRDEAAQANYVVERVLEDREGRTSQAAGGAVPLVGAFRAARDRTDATQHPFVKYGGLKFLDAAHVKDMLAILRFAQNPRDRVSGFRVMQLLPGVGPASAGRVVEELTNAAHPVEAMATVTSPRGAEGWEAFVGLVVELGRGKAGWPAEMDRARDWYQPLLENIHDDAAVRALDLDQLARIATGYPSRERFLTELTLDPPDATSDQAGPPLLDEDYLILSTIHSAKGQEWRSVHVLNVVDGCIPSDLGTGSTHELEEERRLLYVAMTRARDRLHLVVPQRFYPHQQRPNGDRHVYAQRTRFITKPMLAHFDDIYWPPLAPVGTAGASPVSPRLDIAAQMRGLWAK